MVHRQCYPYSRFMLAFLHYTKLRSVDFEVSTELGVSKPQDAKKSCFYEVSVCVCVSVHQFLAKLLVRF